MMEEKNQTIQELVSESLNARRDEIIKNGIDGVKEAVENQIKWKIGYEIEESIKGLFQDKEVKDKLTEEIAKVKIQLVENFTTELAKVVPSIATEFATQLQKRAIKNFTEDSYLMKDFYKQIFD